MHNRMLSGQVYMSFVQMHQVRSIGRKLQLEYITGGDHRYFVRERAALFTWAGERFRRVVCGHR